MGKGKRKGGNFPGALESIRNLPVGTGRKVTAKIIGITSEYIFLDLGGKERESSTEGVPGLDGNLASGRGHGTAYYVGTRTTKCGSPPGSGAVRSFPNRSRRPGGTAFRWKDRGKGDQGRLRSGSRVASGDSAPIPRSGKDRENRVNRSGSACSSGDNLKGKAATWSCHTVLCWRIGGYRKGILPGTMREGMTAKGRIPP